MIDWGGGGRWHDRPVWEKMIEEDSGRKPTNQPAMIDLYLDDRCKSSFGDPLLDPLDLELDPKSMISTDSSPPSLELYGRKKD